MFGNSNLFLVLLIKCQNIKLILFGYLDRDLNHLPSLEKEEKTGYIFY